MMKTMTMTNDDDDANDGDDDDDWLVSYNLGGGRENVYFFARKTYLFKMAVLMIWNGDSHF